MAPPHRPPSPAEAALLSDRLRRHPVFGLLDDAARASALPLWRVQQLAAGELAAEGPELGQALAWVVDGELRLVQGSAAAMVQARFGRDALIGAGAAPLQGSEGWRAEAEAASTLAWLPAAEIARLCAAWPVLTLFLAPSTAGDPPRWPETPGPMGTPVRALLRRAPVTLSPDASVQEAAQRMQAERVSSLLLVDGARLVGIVTDRDLRSRVLATGLDPRTPLGAVATPDPVCVDIEQPAVEAMLLMARHNVHHVPVLERGTVAGLLSANDLSAPQSSSPVYLVSEIHRQHDLAGLVAAAARVAPLQRNLAAAQASAFSTGYVVTAVTDAITVRLLQMAEARWGPPPVPYAWVAAGSQARSEQTARSDQDNCLLLDDAYRADLHGPYFETLAHEVNAGLDACGYVYCPGAMMARTDTWRQPRRRWAAYFQQWTDEPDPQALMLTSVFFDLRAVHGDTALLDGLRHEVLQRTRANRIFLAHLVGNALQHRPPLTVFGGIATTRVGEHADTVNLKHGGVVPIVDLARIYALAGGHAEVNTQRRLAVAARGGEITEGGAHALRDAHEFIATLRIRHQARQRARGEPADHLLRLSELSHFERDQLKDAFGVVHTLQSVLAQRYR